MAETERKSSLVTAARRVPQWVGELVLVAVLYVAYELGRGFHEGTRQVADHTGRTLLHWEQVLHIDPEKWLTVGLDRITVLAVPAAYFYATFHYIITPAVLIWLYVRHRKAYGPARTWLACSTLIGLIMFYIVPTTPPRLLNLGYPDVMADFSSYGWWGTAGSAPKGLGHLTDQLAAMPSLHFGWSLFCGVMIFRHAARTWVRTLGVLYPLTTALVVLSTGNHYVLDVVAGGLVMAAGWGITVLLGRFGRRLHAVLIRREAERQHAAAQELAAAATAPDDVMEYDDLASRRVAPLAASAAAGEPAVTDAATRSCRSQ